MKMLMLMSNGFEEVEAAAPVDILRRAGVSVDMCSITGNEEIEGSHSIRFITDTVLMNVITENDASEIAETYDGVILPGGQPNAGTLRDDERVNRIVRAFYDKGKITAAICASPCVFEKLGILKGRRATSYPGCVEPDSCGEYTNERAVRDGKIITGRSAGTAIDFGLEILRGLGLSGEADKVKDAIIY